MVLSVQKDIDNLEERRRFFYLSFWPPHELAVALAICFENS